MAVFDGIAPAFAANFPDKPKRDSFYSDEAGLLDEAGRKRVNEICWALWKEQKIPLYVVTVTSLADHDAAGQTIEGFAYDLFNAWGIGSQNRNYGILILVSKNDRKARIELGSGWGHKHNYQSEQVMQNLILSHFRRGDYSQGIAQGVDGMNALARGLELPKAKAPWWAIWVQIGLVVLIVGVAYSLFKSGRTGWGWAFLAAVGILLFFLLRASASSGGGMGGGSSGGGGASGSW
ncbi:MAG: TPM domain-containing protein [bacterium]